MKTAVEWLVDEIEKVFVTPMSRGDFFILQAEFDTLEEAKKFVNSIT
jgi:hypothetical protein